MDTIENPITGEKIRVAKSDFTFRMNWEQANAACKSLGDGWRLPTYEELYEMWKNRDAIGGFNTVGEPGDETSTSYWSSTLAEKDEARVIPINIESEDQFDQVILPIFYLHWTARVRAVKSL